MTCTRFSTAACNFGSAHFQLHFHYSARLRREDRFLDLDEVVGEDTIVKVYLFLSKTSVFQIKPLICGQLCSLYLESIERVSLTSPIPEPPPKRVEYDEASFISRTVPLKENEY